jgi:hypothetical protein
MAFPYWGLLATEDLSSRRRVRGLKLGASIRYFNEQAVPGLGGIAFGKPMLWALLGIRVAQTCRQQGQRVSNIEAANAVEAMSCLLAWQQGVKEEERWRVAGSIKLRDRINAQAKISFATARKSSFYVTQPMRMGTVQPLAALGLVELGSTRFNAYILSDKGQSLVASACHGYRPYKKDICTVLVDWIKGTDNPWGSQPLADCLNPKTALASDACALLTTLLKENEQRQSALDWMEELRRNPQQKLDWETRPDCLTDAHWRALYAGACLFAARDAAVAVLDSMERQVGNTASRSVSVADLAAATALDTLQNAARTFLQLKYDEPESEKFCRECVCNSNESVVQSLLLRDGLCLRLDNGKVVPGTAFRGGETSRESGEDKDDEAIAEFNAEIYQSIIQWPDHISPRIPHLYALFNDLQQGNTIKGVA